MPAEAARLPEGSLLEGKGCRKESVGLDKTISIRQQLHFPIESAHPEPTSLRVTELEGTPGAGDVMCLSYLDEWEEEANCEVGQPVDRACDDEGCWPLGLLEELTSQDEWDATCKGQP